MNSGIVLLASVVAVVFHPFIFLWYGERKRNQKLIELAQLQFSLPKEEVLPAEEVNKRLEAKNREIQSKELAINLAERRLGKLDAAKFEFVSVTTHQLRSPLAAIKWTLHMLTNDQLGPITNEQKVFLQKCYESTDRMIAIVNELLKIESIQGGQNSRSPYNPTPTDLGELMEHVTQPLQNLMKEKNIRFNFNRSTEPLTAEVDVEQMRVVFENLFHNAVKYTKPNGEVTVRMSGAKINSARGVIEIAVSDNGIGIPKSDQLKIFQRFFRAPNAIKLVPEGNGLGLAIAKNTIDNHGGQIWFDSRENLGTTFYLSVPVHQNRL